MAVGVFILRINGAYESCGGLLEQALDLFLFLLLPAELFVLFSDNEPYDEHHQHSGSAQHEEKPVLIE